MYIVNKNNKINIIIVIKMTKNIIVSGCDISYAHTHNLLFHLQGYIFYHQNS